MTEPYESVTGCCDHCGAENITIYRSEVGWICVPCVLKDEEHGDYADLYLEVARTVLAAEYQRAQQAEAEVKRLRAAERALREAVKGEDSKISIRRLFQDYCQVIQWSQPGACSVAGCAVPAAQSEYGAICLAGHVADAQGTMPISRTADLALAIVPAVRRDAGMATDLREAQKRYAPPDYASLPDLIRAIEALGWRWESGHSQGPSDPGRHFYARLWLPSLDPMHDEGPAVDERIGWGDTIEKATQRAFEALPPKVGE